MVRAVQPLDWRTTALVLVNLQNDFFGPRAVLRPAFEEPDVLDEVFDRTIALLDEVAATDATIVSAPICFTEGYAEVRQPVGMLASIVSANALRAETSGSAAVDDIRAFGARIHEVAVRRGFDAFVSGELDVILRTAGVRKVLFAGVLSSVCVDASARAAAALGYEVGVISDCTTGRSRFEHAYYCENVFPLYAEVLESSDLVRGQAKLRS